MSGEVSDIDRRRQRASLFLILDCSCNGCNEYVYDALAQRRTQIERALIRDFSTAPLWRRPTRIGLTTGMRSEQRREEWIAIQLPLLRDELERRLARILIGLTSDRVVYPEATRARAEPSINPCPAFCLNASLILRRTTR